MIRYAYHDTSFGIITVGWEDNAVILLKIGKAAPSASSPSGLSELAAAQLQEYFDGRRQEFTFPCRLRGTAFQMAVWEELHRIPYGETRTYGQIAAAIGKPTAARAVGQAANINPIWVAIPCHRVVGRNHSLTGYAGGLDLKQKLLDLEQH